MCSLFWKTLFQVFDLSINVNHPQQQPYYFFNLKLDGVDSFDNVVFVIVSENGTYGTTETVV